jgi:polysaccharide chain length determinant protein (PEP-CTERM system associated)
MINPARSYNLHDYKEIFLRRKWYVIIPFVTIMIGAGLFCLLWPKQYMSTSMILVSPQKVPADYIKPTITASVVERLTSIGAEIMSRTRLERIIDEFKLYQDQASSKSREELVETMRKDIKIDIPQPKKRGDENAGYFSISYTGADPKTVTMVVNRLASLFIEENLKYREEQAQGTTEFLNTELAATKEKMDKAGEEIARYKRQYMGELPEQRDTNLRILEQLQGLYQRNSESLRAAQDRKLVLQKRLSDLDLPSDSSGESGEKGSSAKSGTKETKIDDLKKVLAELQTRYTDKHPDIIALKKRVSDMEKRKDIFDIKNDPRYRDIQTALIATDLEIKRQSEEDAKLKAQMNQYRNRVENAAVREQAMSSGVQEYDNTKAHYELLLKKTQDAQQAENLERRQKGEQFRVIDPAKIPEKPVSPDVPKALLIGLFGGLAAGFGSAFLREQMDQSFRDPEDVEATLGLRILANIPRIDI